MKNALFTACALILALVVIFAQPAAAQWQGTQDMSVEFDGVTYPFACDAEALSWLDKHSNSSELRNGGKTVFINVGKPTACDSPQGWDRNRQKLAGEIAKSSKVECPEKDFTNKGGDLPPADPCCCEDVYAAMVLLDQLADALKQQPAATTSAPTTPNISIGGDSIVVNVEGCCGKGNRENRERRPFNFQAGAAMPFREGSGGLNIGMRTGNDFTRSAGFNVGFGLGKEKLVDSTSTIRMTDYLFTAGADGMIPILWADRKVSILLGGEGQLLMGWQMRKERGYKNVTTHDLTVTTFPNGEVIRTERSITNTLPFASEDLVGVDPEGFLVGKLGVNLFDRVALSGMGGYSRYDNNGTTYSLVYGGEIIIGKRFRGMVIHQHETGAWFGGVTAVFGK